MNKIIVSLLLFLAFANGNAQIVKPVKWSSKVEKISDTEFNLVMQGKIDADWHLYSQYSGGFGDEHGYCSENHQGKAITHFRRGVEIDGRSRNLSCWGGVAEPQSTKARGSVKIPAFLVRRRQTETSPEWGEREAEKTARSCCHFGSKSNGFLLVLIL